MVKQLDWATVKRLDLVKAKLLAMVTDSGLVKVMEKDLESASQVFPGTP